MKVIGKDRTSCDVCNPIDEIIARLDALERRASAIVAKVQGIAPDGEGNVTLPTSSSDTDPLHGRVDAFAMSSEVKEVADDAHAYAASIADDVIILQSDVENLTREVAALDPSSVAALEQSVAALQQTVNQLSNLVGGFSAVIRDLENQMPNKVDRTGDTMTGPLNVIDTVTGSRNTQAVNGERLQNDLDAYQAMVRNSGGTVADPFVVAGVKEFTTNIQKTTATTLTDSSGFWVKIMKWTTIPLRYNIVMTVLSGYYRDNNFYGKLIFGCWDRSNFAHLDLIGKIDWSPRFKLTYDGTTLELWYHNTTGKVGMNVSVFVDIETGYVSKASSAIAIPPSEQVAVPEPDWATYTNKVDCTFMGWTQ